MKPLYSIKDWSRHFENSESRKYKTLTWVPVKNKHDGKGYRRLCRQTNGPELFCAWVLIVQVASKMPVRGVLRDDDGPLDAHDLSDKTGYPSSIFQNALKVLSDSSIGWLVCEISGDAGKSPNVSGETTGEQNRIEQNRTELRLRESGWQDEPSDCPEYPNWELVKTTADRIGLAEWKALDWFYEMEGCGWLDHNKRPIAKWQSVLNRVKTKWEADGRPDAPPMARWPIPAQGKPSVSVYSLTKIAEAKQKRCDELKAIHAVETGLGIEWNSPKARSEFKQLRDEIKQVEKQIREMA